VKFKLLKNLHKNLLIKKAKYRGLATFWMTFGVHCFLEQKHLVSPTPRRLIKHRLATNVEGLLFKITKSVVVSYRKLLFLVLIYLSAKKNEGRPIPEFFVYFSPHFLRNVVYRVARWFVFKPKIEILVNFGGP
jgi:hypothetical protein